jgi:hypothetical protein
MALSSQYGCVMRFKLSGSPWSGPTGALAIQLRQQEDDFRTWLFIRVCSSPSAHRDRMFTSVVER